MDLRQSKRYQVRASATFSWESIDGHSLSGTGYTRDISPNGVFVLSTEKIPLGAAVTLAMTLPTKSGQLPGVSLKTLGRVVRSEQDGFAVAADMGLRMQSSETRGLGSHHKTGGNSSGTHKAGSRKSERSELRGTTLFGVTDTQ